MLCIGSMRSIGVTLSLYHLVTVPPCHRVTVSHIAPRSAYFGLRPNPL